MKRLLAATLILAGLLGGCAAKGPAGSLPYATIVLAEDFQLEAKLDMDGDTIEQLRLDLTYMGFQEYATAAHGEPWFYVLAYEGDDIVFPGYIVIDVERFTDFYAGVSQTVLLDRAYFADTRFAPGSYRVEVVVWLRVEGKQLEIVADIDYSVA